VKKVNSKSDSKNAREKVHAEKNPTIPGKGVEPAKVSMRELKDPDPVEMSEADKKISLEVGPVTPESAKQEDLAVNKGGGYGNRIVHARGSGAHGVFKVINPISQFTKAQFLTESGIVKDGTPADFVKAVKEGRYWER